MVSCKKDIPQVANNNNPPQSLKTDFVNNGKLSMKLNELSYYGLLSVYSRLLSVGLLDVINDADNRSIILSAIENERNLNDENDYEIKLSTLDAAFKANNKDLDALIESSLKRNNNTAYLNLLFKLKQNKYSLTLGKYTHDFTIFIPALNTDIYPNVNVNSSYYVGNILYNLSEDLNFPLISTSTYEASIVNHDFIDQQPILLVSAFIYDKAEVNVTSDLGGRAIEKSGKCQPSKGTGWCTNAGRKCKCDGDGPVIRTALGDFIRSVNVLW